MRIFPEIIGVSPVRLALYDLSHLRYRNLIARPVKDWSIVVDVLNFDRDGADALQRGSATIARLHDIRIMSNSSSKNRNTVGILLEAVQ
jgi:hypothetical protein